MSRVLMLDFRHRVRERARLLRWRRVAAWAARETGDTMIEVVIAALIVGLIAAAVFVGFGAVAQLSGGQRHEAQANELAQQDEERLRGLTVTQLSGATSATGASAVALYGNGSYQETLDGETYTVASTSQFVSASGASPSCTAGGTGNADYVETASTVSWANNNDGLPAVVEHSLISPHAGGSVVIQVDNENSTPGPIPGLQIEIEGPSPSTSTETLTTDANGCVVFGGLAGGTYTVTWPSPYTQESTGATSLTQVVVPGATEQQTVNLSQPGAITANFTTNDSGVTGASGVTGTADTLVVSNSSGTTTYGTTNNYQPSQTTSMTVAPTGSTTPDSVYAGDCASDAPTSPATAVVSGGTTTTVTVPEPAMIVDPWAGTTSEVDDASSALTYYSGASHTATTGSAAADGNWHYETLGSPYTYYATTAHYDGTAGDYVKYTFTGNFVQWLEPTSYNYGYANAYVYNSGGTLVASSTNIDGYSAVASYGSRVAFSYLAPTTATYTIEIYVDGTNDGQLSSGNMQNYVVTDAFISGTLSLLSTKPHVTLLDTGCSNHETTPPTQIPTSATAGALVNPGEPYGTFTVCADNTSEHDTTTLANTNFTFGNVANIFLVTGEPGLTSGVCT